MCFYRVFVRTLRPLIVFSLFLSFQTFAESNDEKFEQLLADHWSATLKARPEFATGLGVRDYDELLSDPSLEAYDARIAELASFLGRANAFEGQALSSANQLNLALFILELQTEIDAAQHGGKYMIMTNRGGPHLSLTNLVGRLPFFTLRDYQSYVSRLKAMPEYLARATARLDAGLNAGWVQPCEPMRGFETSIQTHIVENTDDSVFFGPFKTQPNGITEEQFAELKMQANEIISNEIMPAFKKFEEFYLQSYAPACRTEVGTNSMPGGDDYYRYRVKRFTTTDLSPDDVHQLGQSEVARIRNEMLDVIKQAGFKGSFEEWLIYLRDNPDFYPKTAEQRMQQVAVISKKIDGKLPELFGRLPRMPYGLKEIPADIAEKTTTAYYQRPAGDGSRAGFYFVNTSKLETRPLYQLEALSLHEAVPGHHLQIALAQELDLPNFRKFGGITVFVEGWALYAERLGLEVGFYQTPYTDFGRLSYEMWRACRLVVDTGLHSKDWTRQQAIDFMAENSGLSMNNIVSEIDRYITWPGQALAYKMGELKIRELRDRAETIMGDNFDIRSFHDKVLENGALPLSILEQVINDWLTENRIKRPSRCTGSEACEF